MPLLLHSNPLPKRRRSRKAKENLLPKLNTSTVFESREYVTAIEIANNTSEGMEANRISRILSSAARLSRRASVILPGVGGRKGSVGSVGSVGKEREVIEEGVEVNKEDVNKVEEEGEVVTISGEVESTLSTGLSTAASSSAKVPSLLEESEEAESRPTSKSNSLAASASISASASTPSLYSESEPEPVSRSSTPSPRTPTTPHTPESPQRCIYNPEKDEYIPVATPIAISIPTPPKSNINILELISPTTYHPSENQRPSFELSEIMTPINSELRDLAETSLARAEERKLRFQRKRENQRRDLESQMQRVEEEMRELKLDLLKAPGSADDDKSVYSQDLNTHDHEETQNDEDEVKRIEHRDSGISMGDSCSTAVEKMKLAEEHWRSIREGLSCPDEDTEDEEPTSIDINTNTSSTSHKPALPSRSRARRWSPRTRWEASLGRKLRDDNNGVGDWRYILWISPSLKERLDDHHQQHHDQQQQIETQRNQENQQDQGVKGERRTRL